MNVDKTNRVQEEDVMPLIELVNADIINGGNLLLSNVNVKINRGEFVYLMGRVGSGKSSIIKTLIAEIPLIKGNGRVDNYNLKKIKKRQIPYLRRKCGVIFQDFQLLMDRTVEDNLVFVLQATGWKGSRRIMSRVKEMLELVGMSTKSHKMPHQLSGGEQQRVTIARALLNNPDIILADEPTGNLDSKTAASIMELLMKIHEETTSAILMVTHNRDFVKKYSGRLLVCKGGECVEVESEENKDNLDSILDV